MDNDRLTTVLDGIPKGRWASYADVAIAAGGGLQHARSLNGRLTRLAHRNAHRVLKSNGSIAPTPLGHPEAVRRKLKREGLTFDSGKAPQEARSLPAAGGDLGPRRPDASPERRWHGARREVLCTDPAHVRPRAALGTQL